MAILKNKVISYTNSFERIEHFYGKKVRSINRNVCTANMEILFWDNTYIEFAEYEVLPDNPVFKKNPASFCTSCGELRHAKIASFDLLGRCSTTVKKIWNSARKVYWHRYSKGKV